MKITEITESSLKNNEGNDIDLWAISKNVEGVIKSYHNQKLSADDALNQLDKYDKNVKSVIYDNDEYWNELHKKLPPDMNVTDMSRDWNELEDRIESYRNEIIGGSGPRMSADTVHEDAFVQDVYPAKTTRNQVAAKQKVEKLFKDKK